MDRKIQWISVLIMSGLVATTYAFCSKPFSLGLALGSFLMVMNQFFLRSILKYGLLQPNASKTQFLVLLVGKIILLFGAAWLCMKWIPMDFFGFGLGVALMALIHAFSTMWVKRAQ